MMDAMMVKRAMPKMACMKPSSFSSRHERGTTIRANRNRQNRYEAKHPGFAGTRVSWNSPSEQIRNGPMLSGRLVDHPDPPTVLKDQRARKEDKVMTTRKMILNHLLRNTWHSSVNSNFLVSKISKRGPSEREGMRRGSLEEEGGGSLSASAALDICSFFSVSRACVQD